MRVYTRTHRISAASHVRVDRCHRYSSRHGVISTHDLRYQPACTATGYPLPLSDKARPLFPIVLQFRWIYTRFGSTWEIEFFAGILITITRRALFESQRYWKSKICQRIILYENFQILGIFFFFLFRN